MTTLYIFLFFLGLLLLYYGADRLVAGASIIAVEMGLSPLLVGLTIVAFGTSAPELLISTVSSIQGKSMIALGNVIGSNICNIALVLGMSACFHDLTGDQAVVKRDIPIMQIVSLCLLFMSLDSYIGRVEGAGLLAGIVWYSFFSYRRSVKKPPDGLKHKGLSPSALGEQKKNLSLKKETIRVIIGIAGVIIGAQLLVDSAVAVMRIFHVSEKFIGLTIIAFGTSLPELATSIVAAIKNEIDISIGNLIGSNLFNLMSVLGAASLIRPISVPGGFLHSGLLIDYLVMMATGFIPYFMMKHSGSVTRKGGIILLSTYAGYIAYLILKS